MRKALAALIFVPAIAQAQAALGIGDFLSRARESDSARSSPNAATTAKSPTGSPVAATDTATARRRFAARTAHFNNSCAVSTSDSAPQWMSQFGASVAHDRASLTTRVVDIPLRPDLFFQHFSLSTNQVRTDASDPDKSLQTLLRQKISDAQALADNGGAYSGHIAAQKLFNCGKFAQTFLSFATGYGKLDAPGNDQRGRYAGNVTGQWFNRFVLGQNAGDLELIIGGRGTGLIGGKTLITGAKVTRAFLAEGYTVLKVFNANALTITFTGAPGQPKINKYFSKFAIGLNAAR